MELRKPLPPDRSYEQVKNHYLVERAIAQRLKDSRREERKLIYANMYDELFSKVPDHPRLTRRESESLSRSANIDKLSLVQKYLDNSITFLEFAPGDCKFVNMVACYVKQAYGVDISDQRALNDSDSDNFKLILYDGINLNEIQPNSIDIVFSDQLIEHLHPDDTKDHFKLVHSLLKKGGRYIFRTPHYLTGPHDVSQYFSDISQGFHLKEWTYIEIKQIIDDLGFSKFNCRWRKKGADLSVPFFYFSVIEKSLSKHCLSLSRYLIPCLYGASIK